MKEEFHLIDQLDFVFETRESKTEFSFRPSEDKTEKQTAGSKNRLYQEKQSKHSALPPVSV